MMTDRGRNPKLVLRSAHADDCATVFQWRNDPFIMLKGTSQEPVSLPQHSRWFAASLASPDQRLLFIVECDGDAAGLARFDRDGVNDAIIGVYLIERFTGQGLGVAAIRSACHKVAQHWDVRRILAHVRNDNPAGMKAFERAGFVAATDGKCPPDHRGFEYVL